MSAADCTAGCEPCSVAASYNLHLWFWTFDRHQNLIICSFWPIANLPWKFHANPCGSLCTKLLINKQRWKQPPWRRYKLSVSTRGQCRLPASASDHLKLFCVKIDSGWKLLLSSQQRLKWRLALKCGWCNKFYVNEHLSYLSGVTCPCSPVVKSLGHHVQ